MCFYYSTMPLVSEALEDLLLGLHSSIEPWGDGSNGSMEVGGFQDEADDYVLHPGCAALGGCRNDDVSRAKLKAPPTVVVGHDPGVSAHSATLVPTIAPPFKHREGPLSLRSVSPKPLQSGRRPTRCRPHLHRSDPRWGPCLSPKDRVSQSPRTSRRFRPEREPETSRQAVRSARDWGESVGCHRRR